MFKSDLQAAIGSSETILWQGKPNKKCFILEGVFNPMLPFALLWGAIDFWFISMIFKTDVSETRSMMGFIVPFFAFHLMPVWMYLGGILAIFFRYRNTEYIITNLGVYISGGTFSYSYEMKPFAELSHIAMNRGIFDQILGVGDVELSTAHTDFSNHRSRGKSIKFSICDIEDYQRVYQMVKQMQTDIYSDTMYPNDLRPEENHGYNTKYTKLDDFQNWQ
ncbi:MAG: PH domain-containing protein [Lachnospiraceae bacterium]|nr:PH domain-containing protein [Lachnospiraceae bacterium]